MSQETAAVLLVEDNRGDARLFLDMLAHAESFGCRVTHVVRLDEAVRLLGEGGYALVLLDLSLPDSRGIETFLAVQAVAPDVPVVVLSGADDEALSLEAVQAGAQDYLAKDHADRYTLVRAVRYALERKRAERAARERKGLQEAIGAMEQVLGVVAHELRTPLTSLRLISEYLLTEEGRDMSLNDHFLRSINSEVLRMADMVTTILEAARLESGAARWNWGVVSAEQVCRDALEVVGPLVDHSQIELSVSVRPETLTFAGDSDALRRLLVNLINNALRHTVQGGIEVGAAEVHRDGERWVHLSVRDTGSGIPEQIAGKLGEAFALNAGVATSTRPGGTGLGLAICRGIASVHGGEITLATAVGRGSTFTAVLRADLAGPEKSGEPPRIFREAAA